MHCFWSGCLERVEIKENICSIDSESDYCFRGCCFWVAQRHGDMKLEGLVQTICDLLEVWQRGKGIRESVFDDTL